MATIQHKNLPNADLHEPKGVSTASDGDAYIADGAGSGAWAEVVSPADSTAANQVFISDALGSGVWAAQTTAIHAAAKVAGNSTEITPSGAGTFMEWTPTWTSVNEDGITITGNSFVIDTAGSYFIIASLTSQGRGTGANTYAFDFAKNGTVVGQKSRRTTSSTSDVGSVVVQAYLNNLVATDVIKLYVTNETDTDNVLVTDINLFIFRLN